MDWLDRMNAAMDYIEANLTGEIEFVEVAKLAQCSTHHFQRMFSFITGVPLSEYIRRRRLTLAAFELSNTEAKVIDLAFKYGYDSPEAFSRAFSKLHGVAPMAARDKGVILKAYPRMSFHISIKGEEEMKYRIEEKSAFELFGMSLQTNVIDGQCFRDIPAFWDACEQDGRCVALARAASKGQGELLDAGVTYGHNPNGDMKYMIACLTQKGADTKGYDVLPIPIQSWAIFHVDWKSEEDMANLHDTWRRIYAEWFPTAPFEHALLDCDLEMYYGDGPGNYFVEIWIPVEKKQ